MRAGHVLLGMLLSGPVAAQSVNPPIAVFEGGGTRARGSLVIDNPTLFPVTYVVEAKHFAVAACGDMAFGPVDTTRMQVRLSGMSGRLAAKQRATIFYDIQVDSVPAWLALVVALTPGRPQAGLNIRLEIPHMIYVMQRDRPAQDDVAIEEASYDSVSRTLAVRVVNRSPKLMRITELVARSAGGREVSLDACPLFPNSTREFSFPWLDSERPSVVIAKFPGFSAERAVGVTRASSSAGGVLSCVSLPSR